MPTLIIDEQEILVPEGTKVIEAAERLGIMIPRFCYHEALGSVGACRMCAVSFKQGPVKGLEMSCMVEAEDGMVVSTVDPEAVAFRERIIECLMLNHPHDCPVCDEGGHCLLQDETVSAGHGIRRYPGKKRTYMDQDLGPFVQHEMNRCIHCWRCRRFYQDFAGYRDLGAMQIANRTYFGRFRSGPLESPFSGNLIDICPTGVYTDKPARFKGRRWNFERGPSLCIHCSLGCNTTTSARYREVMRQEARYNKEVNGYFICDRGRFGFDFANHPDRIRKPRLENKAATWEQAVDAAAATLKRIHRKRGPDSILCLGSVRCSLETQGALKRLCRLLEWPEPRYFIEPKVERKVRTSVTGLDERVAASMAQVEEADFILSLGVDPINEAPMLVLAMRQARRKNATVVVADPRPVFLPFDFFHFPMEPGVVDYFACALVYEALKQKTPESLQGKARRFYESLPAGYGSKPGLGQKIQDLGRKLGGSKKPMLICGTDLPGETTVALASDLAHLLQEFIEGTGLFYVLPGPNAFGAALMSPKNAPGPVVELIESGRIKALVLVEQDPFWLFPDRHRLEKALDKLEYLLVLDYLPSLSAKRAHAVLPTTTLFERIPVTLVNHEGRAQKAFPVHRGGTPLSQVSEGKHPPRTFLDHIPGGEPRAAHEVLAELYAAVSGQDKTVLLEDLREAPGLDLSATHLLPQEPSRKTYTSEPAPPYPRKERMELLLVDWTFGTEELSCYSRVTMKAESAPRFQMHPGDAARLGLAEGDRIAIALNGGEFSMELRLAPSMAAGVIIAPRHRQVRWQELKEGPIWVTDQQIHKR
jgi:NADH-quinone oxidoreductase subunit G